MGIDAEMFVRLKGRDRWLNEDRVRELAYMLGSTIGYDKFFISDEHHALTIIQPWNAADEGCYEEDDGRVVWHQDGDSIYAATDEQFIRVHFYTRFYGEGYERGSWPTIYLTAEFLEHHIPNCEVWYGGDSSGCCAEYFGAAERAKLHRHWLDNGGRPYRSGWGSSGPACPLCQVRMSNTGGGPDRSFVYCQGCGREEVVFHSGVRRKVPRGKEMFDVRTVNDGEPVTA